MTTYNITKLKGDTYDGAKITLSRPTDPAISLIGTFICQFKRVKNGAPLLTWTVGAGITLDMLDPTAYYFDPCIFPLDAGVYYFDVEVTFADGSFT